MGRGAQHLGAAVAEVVEGMPLPAVSSIDALTAAQLVEALTQLGALTERARARMTILALQGSAPSQNDPDDLLTAAQVAEQLNARPAWVYRHARQLGGQKLDGLMRFSRRRVLAYVDRQRRLSA